MLQRRGVKYHVRLALLEDLLQSGSVAINTGVRTSFDAPFGGYKQSGIGKERGLEAIYENTQLKNVKYDMSV